MQIHVYDHLRKVLKHLGDRHQDKFPQIKIKEEEEENH